MAARLRSTTSSVVAQDETLIRNGDAPRPGGPAAPACAVPLNPLDDPKRRIGISERDQHLVQHYFVEDFAPGRPQDFRKRSGMAAGPSDQKSRFRAPCATVRAQTASDRAAFPPFSHLCASVAQESASAMPAARWARSGHAAASGLVTNDTAF